MVNRTPDGRELTIARRAFLLAGGATGAAALLSGTAGAGGDKDMPKNKAKNGEYTTDIDNTYFPLPVGRRLTLKGEEDGEEIKVRITVLDETEEVGDVTTRVVEEREWEDGELIEISLNYFAQAKDGTVWYFGEAVDIYEDGEVVSHEGAWRADERGNGPGVFMPAEPERGQQFAQEEAPGVAEDRVIVIGEGETVEVPEDEFEDCLRTYDWDGLEPTEPGDIKVYAPDVGLIVDGPVSLVKFRE